MDDTSQSIKVVQEAIKRFGVLIYRQGRDHYCVRSARRTIKGDNWVLGIDPPTRKMRWLTVTEADHKVDLTKQALKKLRLNSVQT